MKIRNLVILGVIIILLCVSAGCISDDEKKTYDINCELVSAWEGLASEENPTSSPEYYMERNFSSEQYLMVNSSDDNCILSQNSGSDDGYPYLLFKFKLEDTIKSLKITWEGYGSQPFMGSEESEVRLYLYNVNELIWDKIGSKKWETDNTNDKVIKKEILKISNYKSSENEVYILVIGPYGAGNSTTTLATDFIEMKGA